MDPLSLAISFNLICRSPRGTLVHGKVATCLCGFSLLGCVEGTVPVIANLEVQVSDVQCVQGHDGLFPMPIQCKHITGSQY